MSSPSNLRISNISGTIRSTQHHGKPQISSTGIGKQLSAMEMALVSSHGCWQTPAGWVREFDSKVHFDTTILHIHFDDLAQSQLKR